MSILCASSSFENILELISPFFDWCSINCCNVLLKTSKKIINIIISRLLVQYIKKTICPIYLYFLKGVVVNMPNLINSYYCYNLIGLIGIGAKNPDGSESTINFNFIYKTLHIDLFNNNSLTLMKLPFSAFKKMYFNIISQYYNDIGNGGHLIPTNFEMPILLSELKINAFNNNTRFIRLVNIINMDMYNVHWFSLLLYQITNYNFIELSTINLMDLGEFNRLKLILSEPIYTQCTHMLSDDSIDILTTLIKRHTNLFYKNLNVRNINEHKKILQWYTRYIIQSALLLKILISKFQDVDGAYRYIAKHLLSDDDEPHLEFKKNKLLCIPLLLLNITNSTFKYNIVKEAVYFSGYTDSYHYNYGEMNITYYLNKHLMVERLSPCNDIYMIMMKLIKTMIKNEFEHDKENMSIILQNKEIQKSFYDYSIFHIYYGTVFYELLPIDYKFLTSHNKCYSGLNRLISITADNIFISTLLENNSSNLDLIASYLLFFWKAIRNTKTIKIKYVSTIFKWFMNNCKFHLFIYGGMFADYTDIITCNLDKSAITNYSLLHSIVCNYNDNIPKNAKLILPFLIKYIVLDDRHISLLLKHIIKCGDNLQFRIDFLKMFKSDLTEIAETFSKSKKKILSQYIL